MFKCKNNAFRLLGFIFSVGLASGNAFGQAPSAKVEESIKAHAKKAVSQYASANGWVNTKTNVQVWMPASWIDSNPCSQEVKVKQSRASKPWGRVSYDISCEKPEWRTRGRATVNVKTQMAVAQKTLRRGDVVTSNDVAFKQMSMDRVYADILSTESEVIGKRVLRSVRSNSVIPEQSISAPFLVEKNMPVMIEVNTMGIRAQMKGTALDDASLGERVSVKNASSGKTLSATVSGKGLVSVSR